MRGLLVSLLLASCAAAPPTVATSMAVRLGSTTWQEDESIYALAISPDGTRVATGNAAGDVLLSDASSGAVLLAFPQHDGAVRALAFSPDGSLLASTGGSLGGSRRTFVSSLRDGGPILDCTLSGESSYDFGSLAFSPDGKTLAVGGMDVGLRILDLAGGPPGVTWDLATWGICAIAWSGDGKTLLCGCGDGSVKVVEAATGKILRSNKDARPAWVAQFRTVAFVDGGRSVIAARVDGLIDRWSVDGSGGRTLDDPAAKFTGGALSPGRDLLVVAVRDGTLRRIDPGTGQETGRAMVSKRALLCAAFFPDGNSVACAGEDGAIRIVDAMSGEALRGPTGHLGPVYCVVQSPDARLVATGGRDGTARLWEADTGREISLLCSTGGPIYAVAFSADGRTVACGGWDGVLRCFDVGTFTPVGDVVDYGAEIRRILPGLIPAGPGEPVETGTGGWVIFEDGTAGTMGR